MCVLTRRNATEIFFRNFLTICLVKPHKKKSREKSWDFPDSLISCLNNVRCWWAVSLSENKKIFRSRHDLEKFCRENELTKEEVI